MAEGRNTKRKPGVKRAKDLRPRNARSVQGGSLSSGIYAAVVKAGGGSGGGTAQGAPILGGWDLKANNRV